MIIIIYYYYNYYFYSCYSINYYGYYFISLIFLKEHKTQKIGFFYLKDCLILRKMIRFHVPTHFIQSVIGNPKNMGDVIGPCSP